MTKTVSFDGETISINAGWLAKRIAEGEIDAKQLWALMHHELHLLNFTETRMTTPTDEWCERRAVLKSIVNLIAREDVDGCWTALGLDAT
tara:strand:+ start:508 stop:777 length:270 start_codon:yes stop_codon:yes gene_type:complete